VLHWINFAADLKGYLHWGWNFWGNDPFGPPRDRLPPGDSHVVYPGKNGPLNSIRWEIQRESLEDFEYLHLLTEETAKWKERLGAAARWLEPQRRAKELCRRIVPDIADTQRDFSAIWAARTAVAEEILKLKHEPLLLVQTEPPEGATLVEGPIFVELRGVTRPDARVTVNGKPVEVRADGSFSCSVHLSKGRETIRVEASRAGQKTVAVRRFRVRT